MTDKLKKLLIFSAVAAAIFALAVFGIYRCPLDHMLGIPCPMCGITRALSALLKGDIYGAFYYHPLWPAAVLAVFLYILYYFGVIKVSKKVFDISCGVLIAMAIGCFVIRHIQHSPVVAVHFDTSVAGRVLQRVRNFK